MYFTTDDELDALAHETADDLPAVIREETRKRLDQKEEQIDEGHHFLCVSNVWKRSMISSEKISYYYRVENWKLAAFKNK